MLPAGARRAIGIHPHIIQFEIDLCVVFDLRQNFHECERGVAPVGGVVG